MRAFGREVGPAHVSRGLGRYLARQHTLRLVITHVVGKALRLDGEKLQRCWLVFLPFLCPGPLHARVSGSDLLPELDTLAEVACSVTAPSRAARRDASR